MNISGNFTDGNYYLQPMPSYMCQFASNELVSAYLDGEAALEDDPRGQLFGFDSMAEYAYWAPRLCGVVCVHMILRGLRNIEDQTNATLTRQALELGGYKVETDQGWYYKPLVALGQSFGLGGKVFTAADTFDLCREIYSNHAPVVSVEPNVIRGDTHVLPTGKAGGHLVVLVGFKWKSGMCRGFFIHNPSGRLQTTQERCYVPIERFEIAYAGRGFSLWQIS